MWRTRDAWQPIGTDLFLLGLEASEVVLLRTLKLMQGGATSLAEAQLMVAEKVAAAIELQQQAVLGQLGTNPRQAARKTAGHLRRKVRENRRRLRL